MPGRGECVQGAGASCVYCAAARGGSAGQFFYGSLETDFGPYANLADQSLRWFKMGYPGPGCLQPCSAYPPEINFPLHDERFRDKYHVVDYVGQCDANAWQLRDMVGTVSEWTRSSYRPYPYVEDDGRNGGGEYGIVVVNQHVEEGE